MALCCACLFLATPKPALAKVFRWGGRAPEELNNGSLPWDNAYKASMTVNGRKALLWIYSARHSEPVAEQLRSRFQALGAEVEMCSSEHGVTGKAKWPDREASFFTLSPPQEPTQQIFVYYPEPGSVPKEVRFPVPEYMRGKVLTTISDDDTSTFFATIETSDSATEIHSFYARELSAKGWAMVAPARVANGTVSGMAAYQKKSKVCYVQAVDRMGRPNMITLLVKGGAL